MRAGSYETQAKLYSPVAGAGRLIAKQKSSLPPRNTNLDSVDKKSASVKALDLMRTKTITAATLLEAQKASKLKGKSKTSREPSNEL